MHNQHWAQMVPFNSSSTVSQPNVPRPTYNDVGVSGTIDLNARIEQSMSGLDGRLSAAMDQALNDVLGGGVQIQ